MSFKLKFEPIALENIASSITYYESISDELGARFKSSLKNLFLELERSPKIYQIRYRDVRVGLANSFSFTIHYRVLDGFVFILKVIHTSRNY